MSLQADVASLQVEQHTASTRLTQLKISSDRTLSKLERLTQSQARKLEALRAAVATGLESADTAPVDTSKQPSHAPGSPRSSTDSSSDDSASDSDEDDQSTSEDEAA